MTLNASSNPHGGIKDWEGKVGADYTVVEKNMPDIFAWDITVDEEQRQRSRIHSMTGEQMWRNVWCTVRGKEGEVGGWGLRPSGCLHQRG